MSSKFRIKLIGGIVAMTVAGATMANTSIDAVATGDLFLNIVDSTANTSYLFDTGVSQAAFNGSMSYTFNLSSDSNLKSFLNGADSFNYSVISATKPSGASTLDFTGGALQGFTTPITPSAFLLNQTQASVANFLAFANTVTSTSTNSAVIPTGSGASGYWGQSLSEGSVSTKLFNDPLTPYADAAAVGTPLSFFNAVGSTLTTFAGTWNFSSATDTLSYSTTPGGGGSTVPLPPTMLLLLSGLGLMGAKMFSRREGSSLK